MRAQGQIPGLEGAQGPQAIHRGVGTQDAAHDLRHAEQKHALRGQERGLRGLDGGAQRAQVAADAGQARLRSYTRLI